MAMLVPTQAIDVMSLTLMALVIFFAKKAGTIFKKHHDRTRQRTSRPQMQAPLCPYLNTLIHLL